MKTESFPATPAVRVELCKNFRCILHRGIGGAVSCASRSELSNTQRQLDALATPELNLLLLQDARSSSCVHRIPTWAVQVPPVKIDSALAYTCASSQNRPYSTGLGCDLFGHCCNSPDNVNQRDIGLRVGEVGQEGRGLWTFRARG